MGYNSKRPHRVPLLTAKNMKSEAAGTQAHKSWTAEDWKNIWSSESPFLLRHADGRVRIWRQQHEFIDPTCLVSTVRVGDLGPTVGGMFPRLTLGPLTQIIYGLKAAAYQTVVADHVASFMARIYAIATLQ